MSIWVTGDTHGSVTRFTSDIFPEQKEMNKDEDFLVILGDFGMTWDYRGETKRENWWLEWLEDKPFTTLFVDGNHENFNRLYEYPIKEWHGGLVHEIRPHVLHLMRGQVYEIDGKKVFSFGGASSHDIDDGILDIFDSDFEKKYEELREKPFARFRIDGISWWKQELPTEEEMNEGLENLKKHDNKVDFIFTHSPYTSLLKYMDGGRGLYESDILSDYLQQIKQTIDYKAWMFGHMHLNQTFHWERAHCLYEQIIRIA